MSEANWYTTTFKAWQVKLLGPQPGTELLEAAHNLGNKPGKQSLALAMALRECGVTGPQIIIACGAPQNNKRRDMIEASYVKRVPVPNDAQGHTVYRIELTAKGKQRCEHTVANALKKVEAGNAVETEGMPSKPIKAKGKLKVKKAVKGKAVETPTSEAVTGIEQVPAVEQVTEQPQAE